jgi:hypothetical protein
MKADDTREPAFNAAESKTPRMCGNSVHGNRESPRVSSQDGGEERSGKAAGRTPDMHAGGQSDDSIVPKKRANKAGEAARLGYCGTRRRKVAVHGGSGSREGEGWFLKWATIESQMNSKAERFC